MADEIDNASETIEANLAQALKAQKLRAENQKTQFTGKCLWCEDPTQNRKLFCSLECRDFHTLKNRR
jgi:hypothetical protein